MRQSPLQPLHHPDTDYRTSGDSVVAASCQGLEEDYGHVRGRAGLMDLASLGLTALTGDSDDVESFLNDVLARDVTYLVPERSMTSLMLDDDGGAVDVVTIHRLENGVIVESSFGNGDRTREHLRRVLDESAGGLTLTDLGEERTTIGIEGPYSWAEIGEVLDQELTALPYESIVGTEWNGTPMLFARSGFTGEYGYKVIVDNDHANEVWERLAQSVPQVGQDALEVAMLEIRQPILAREWTTGSDVVTCGLNWLVDLSKEAFRGREAVMELTSVARRTVGFRSDSDIKEGTTLELDGTPIGEVVFTAQSPGLGCHIGLLRIDASLAASGLEISASTPQGETFDLRTVSSPYVVPTSWSVPLF